MEELTEVKIALDEEFVNLADSVSFTLRAAGFKGDIKFWAAVLGVATGHMKLLGFPQEEVAKMVRYMYNSASEGKDMPFPAPRPS